MTAGPEIPDEIAASEVRSRAVSLRCEGVLDAAWFRDDALQVIGLARAARVGILGGDVWTERRGARQARGENWYCDVEEGESASSFAERSCAYAEAYVSSYREPHETRCVFAITFASRARFLGHQASGIREAARRELADLDDGRMGKAKVHFSQPELREWETDGRYHAEFHIEWRREGRVFAVSELRLFDSDALVSGQAGVRRWLVEEMQRILVQLRAP